ncbi:MAG TPA: VIT1/CCC1 transporter family protein [Pyrinomonadaceae bacterium]|nr:VIT1/CCC1 transporter family protein [Pyrinomonadaceae bacterium]
MNSVAKSTDEHATPFETASMEHEHSPDRIRERLEAGPAHNYLRDWIYGGIDGAVTTLAVVTGVAGAQLSNWVVLVLGFANLFADGFSMAASNYLGTRAEQDDWRRLERIEHRHIELEPEGEREEIRQIFERKGFEGADLNRMVELITSNRERWVKTMLTDEYGLPHSIRSAWTAAFSTFTAFLICGLVPLLPYLFGTTEHSLALSAVLTAFVFFAIGSIKSRWSTSSWWHSGLTTLFVGAIAAALAYFVGVILRTVFGVAAG